LGWRFGSDAPPNLDFDYVRLNLVSSTVTDAVVKNRVRTQITNGCDVIVVTGTRIAALAVEERDTAGQVATPWIVLTNDDGDWLRSDVPAGTQSITGCTSAFKDFVRDRVDMLRKVFPAAANIGLLHNDDLPEKLAELADLQSGGGYGGLGYNPIVVKGTGTIAAPGASNALLTLGDAASFLRRNNTNNIIAYAANNSRPAMYHHGHFVTAGGLMSYGPNMPALYARAAVYVHQILTSGSIPPVYVPTPELWINLATAGTLSGAGVTIPPDLLVKADYLI
jgi:putative ABC transport system substrate-binding protein